jgi:hypothetical protein
VDSFRKKSIRKAQAIYKIGQILSSDSRGDEQVKFDSLERYAITLDGIESLASQLDRHGTRVSASMLGKRKDELGERGRRPEEPVGNNPTDLQEDDVDSFLRDISDKHDGLALERDTREDKSDGGDDLGYDIESEERGRSNKKQRIYESQMPWFHAEQQVRRSNTNRSCNKTRNTLDIFQRDGATVKRWIRCATSAPAGFPSTEWDSLIKGESVDIDTVFSSLHHVHSIDESIGRVGDTEIFFGKPKPAAKVETSGQWAAAYNLIVKATSFLFPHHYDELKQYGDYIEELFSAKSIASHPKLFKYDEAIRYKVGQGQNILLTDRSEFTRYYEAIVAPDGVGAQTPHMTTTV